jgi:glucose/arabinose dehydrogenase
VRCVRQDEQARRRRPAGASAAPVILTLVRRARVLIAAVGVVLLGCGGGGDRATARSTATPTPRITQMESPTPNAAVAKPGLRLRKVGTFNSPVYVTSPPGDRHRIFVVEQGGTIRILKDGKKLGTPFLNVSGRISSGGERGLLSMAFAPNYRKSGRFYVYYTATNGDVRIVRYRRASADRAAAGSGRTILSVTHPASNHNGGLLLFGPDKRLYAGLGDGGGGGDRHGAHGNAQNLHTFLGKIIRFNNPAAAHPKAHIYAYGLRNPWRYSFASNGRMVIGDVGQNEVEEVDIINKQGSNLGWRVFEGRHRYTPGESAPGAIPPVIERFHSDGNCSVVGGVVVRDPVLSALRGRYIFGDYCRGVIESARLEGLKAHDVRATSLHVSSLSSFGVDGRKRAYAVSLSGPVYRLVPRG